MDRKTSTIYTRKDRYLPREFSFSEDDLNDQFWIIQPDTYFNRLRKQAWETFLSLPMPTTSDEAWRRTDIRGLKADEFILHGNDSRDNIKIPSQYLRTTLTDKKQGGQIVLTPNRTGSIYLHDTLVEQGIIFTDLPTSQDKHADKLECVYGQIVRPDEGKFAALSSALAKQGIFIYVPPNVSIDVPLHSIIWGPGKGYAFLTHVLIYLDKGSSLTYVHEEASNDEDEGQGLHSGIFEVLISDGAKLNLLELQSWGKHYWNFKHERVRILKEGSLDWTYTATGSHLTKSFLDIDLAGEGSSAKMSGFYFTDGNQHFDYDTQQNHFAPNTTSDLLFKGALKDRSRAIWQGMIYVAPNASKADGYQANRNITLSQNARADSIPGLEILTDDVRCSHGATIGKIDQDQIFYLQSRGIPKSNAIKLIVEGFFDPIMQRIPFNGVRNRLQHVIQSKLNN